MSFSTYTIHLIAQNRSLQKSIRAKYNQPINVAGSDDSVARLELTQSSKQQADNTRRTKLIKKAIIAIFLFIPFAYYSYQWILTNPFGL